MEESQVQDRVIFQNVLEQYVKGQDVTVLFTISHSIKVNPNEDQIGLLRIGYTNVKECLVYTSVRFNPSTTSESIHHGTATFPSSSLPIGNDEFYQFCYIINKTKNLGVSIPFQLNYTLDDIDLLSNTPISEAKSDDFVALSDHDNDDIIVIHTKRMLTEEKLRQENRQLLELNHRLALQKDTCQGKLDLLKETTKEHINKISNDMQILTASHKIVVDELSFRQQFDSKFHIEYNACRSLCNQYQEESSQYAERCCTLENALKKNSNETNQLRSQLALTSQLTKNQAIQIIDLERRLMQANESSKTVNQCQTVLERQLRDLHLTSEKYERSMQGHVNALEKDFNLSLISKQHLDQLHKQQIRDLQLTFEKQQRSMQGQINALKKEESDRTTLKTSFTEIEKRCVKYQKGEIEAKRQITIYQNFVNDLQREIQHLTEQLTISSKDYKTLLYKYNALECKMETKDKSTDVEVHQCPVCNRQFPPQMTLDEKKEHIEQHFENVN